VSVLPACIALTTIIQRIISLPSGKKRNVGGKGVGPREVLFSRREEAMGLG